MSLWSNDDVRAWKRAHDGYPARVDAREVNRLPELDGWYRHQLPGILAHRKPPQLTRAELVDVTSWKMKRGKYRARNLALVQSNPEADVERRSRDAFAAMPDLRIPVAQLAELSGVGPATASAVLAALRPDVYPFFDEDVAAQIPSLGEVKFTLPYYLRYAEALRTRAEKLGKPWTAHEVAQALWAVRP